MYNSLKSSESFSQTKWKMESSYSHSKISSIIYNFPPVILHFDFFIASLGEGKICALKIKVNIHLGNVQKDFKTAVHHKDRGWGVKKARPYRLWIDLLCFNVTPNLGITYFMKAFTEKMYISHRISFRKIFFLFLLMFFFQRKMKIQKCKKRSTGSGISSLGMCVSFCPLSQSCCLVVKATHYSLLC